MKEKIITAEFSDIIGQEHVKTALKSTLLANRNAIIVGPPGIGKTTLAKNVAKILPSIETADCPFNCLPEKPCCPQCMQGLTKSKKKLVDRFVRIQGSPDLTAEDLIGDIDPIKALKYGPLSIEAFTPGKIFKANNGLLFFDEINRCSDKLQNALLQVLEEKHVTVASYDVNITSDFLFIGTMNPQDTSTEQLSDVFLDRFDLIRMTYPESFEIEKAIIEAKAMTIEGITFPPKLQQGVITFIRQLREDANIEKKPSVRATLGVIDRSMTTCQLRNGKTVNKNDVTAVIISVLSHRISLKPSVKYLKNIEEYVEERFAEFSLDHLGGEG